MRIFSGPAAIYRLLCVSLLFAILCFGSLTSWWQSPWRNFLFDASAMALACVVLLPSLLRRSLPSFPPLVPFALCVLLGIVQVIAHSTVYPYPTEESILRGFALLCLFWCANALVDEGKSTSRALDAMLLFAALVTLAGGIARELRPGMVFGLFPRPKQEMDIFAGFTSYNEYAQFAELFIPIAIWKAVRRGLSGWPYWMAALLLTAAVIGMGSRMGSALVALEWIVVFLLAIPAASRRRLIPAVLCAGVIGAGALLWILQVRRGGEMPGADHLGYRLQMGQTAIAMWRDHPLTGVGLGNYTVVFPAYATFDIGLFVNAAHNDFLQALAEGGPLFICLLAWLGLSQLRGLKQARWGIGLPAVMLHSLTDFPFHRLSVVPWFVILLALINGSGRAQKQKRPLPE